MGWSVANWALMECKGSGGAARCDGQTSAQAEGKGGTGWEKETRREVGSGCRWRELDREFAPWHCWPQVCDSLPT